MLTTTSLFAAGAPGQSGPNVKPLGGAGMGRLNLDDRAGAGDTWACKNEMVLVERIQGKPKTKGGLVLPDEQQPRLHLGQVLSMGPGKEEENGRLVPMPDIKIGDYVILKNPWGIGPKDEETGDGKKLSFMRGQDIAAVIQGDILPED